MGAPTLYGAPYSVYVRIARLTLEEKGVAYRLEPVDIFAEGGPPPEHLARHPWAKIPAFEHDGFALYEAAAIARYVDEAFDGPALQPADARGRARMTQVIGLLDSYGYRPMVWEVFVARTQAGAEDVSAGLKASETALDALSGLMDDAPWLAGPALTLADLHAAPMLAYFRLTEEGAAALAARPTLAAWWERIATRPSMRATVFDGEAGEG